LLFIDIFGEAMGLKGPKMIPFWCLMPKGEKLRPKQMDQIENFENSRVRIWFCQNTQIAKFGLLWGKIFDYGKKGEFLVLDQFFSWNISWLSQTSVFDLEIGKGIDLQKQTKWWQRVIQIYQIISKNNLVFNLIQHCTSLVAFWCVGINHQKGEIEREICSWAISISILVIRCPTH
jgi:hypothetical protein